MTISRSLIPQLLFNLCIMIGCLMYAPRSIRSRKNRFLTVAFFLIGLAALILNLKGYALRGPLQGGGVDRV